MSDSPCDSLWLRTAVVAPPCPPLAGEVAAEVAIIGAGYTGSAAALRLAESGRDVVMLDAVEPGFGASGRNTGWWVPFWTGMTPDKAIARFGKNDGTRFVEMMIDGARMVPRLVEKHGIDCSPRPVGVICGARTPKALTRLYDQAAQWRKFGAAVEDLGAVDMGRFIAADAYIGGIHYRDAGYLQPLSYCRGLAGAARKAGARIHGNSPVVRVSQTATGWSVATPSGHVRARQVLLATNAFPALLDQLKSKFMPVRIGMIASAPFPDQGKAYLPGGVLVADMDSHDMFGVGFDGAGRLVTSTLPPFDSSRAPADIAGHYWRMFRRIFTDAPPRVKWETAWEGHVCMPPDMLVKTGQISPGLFTAFGYSGNGIAQATVVGTEIADWMITGDRARLRVPPMKMKSIPLAALASALVNRALLPALNYAIYR